MRNRWKKQIGILWLMGVLLTSLLGCTSTDNGQLPDGQTQDPVAVMVQEAAREDLTDYLRFSGRVTGGGEIPVISLSSGFVKEVYVELGDSVKKDDVIAQLDDEQISEQIEELEDAIDDLNERMDEIEAEEDELLGDSEDDILPDPDFDRLTQVTQLMSEMQIIAAQLGQLESALAQAEAQKENMTVKAQVGGTVGIVSVVPGSVVASGNPVAILLDTSKMYVDIHVFENQIGRIEKDLEGIIHIPAYSEYPLWGSVETVSPVLNAQTRAFTVRMRLDELEKSHSLYEKGVLIGMFARVEIPAQTYENVLTLPREAVLERYEGTYVFVVMDQKAAIREVKTGFHTNELVEITDGIEEGEWVVVSGQQFLEDQDPVAVRGWGEEQ